ncbi:hypothetical protein [Actinoplanes utahensis]|uniref:hypothetical protein n=1 Tax=Actinoplanes utahensis TaxID=1869 RepID=UPI00126A14BE|nr:hypothetical protein [Actinoplanes utahensis]GIF29604.1 hypothetical protein Aut01nite_25900 [Actinoplanes utahensis]
MGVRDRTPWLNDEYWIVGDLWQRRGRSVRANDAEVVEIAHLLGRSPDSITWRVGNFASTDEPGRGPKPITGEPLEGWKKLRGNRAALARAVAQARARMALLTTDAVSRPDGTGVRIIAPEIPSGEPITVVTQAAARQADQAEAVLRERFRAWRDPKGQRLRGISISTPNSTLRVDLYDPVASLLIEVKATAERDHLRFAVGQLYDYRRYLDFAVDLAVLVPTEPSADLMGLLDAANVGAIWQAGRSFADSEGGRYAYRS